MKKNDLTKAWKELIQNDFRKYGNVKAIDTFTFSVLKAICDVKARYFSDDTISDEKYNEKCYQRALDYLLTAFSPSKKIGAKWQVINKLASEALSSMYANPFAPYMTPSDFSTFKEIVQRLEYRIPDTNHWNYYSHFYVRADLTPEYQLVQNSHVALELGVALTKANISTYNLYFWCCSVPNEAALIDKMAYFDSKRLRYVSFTEPDIDGEYTAIATFPVLNRRRKKIFGNDKKLVFKR